MDENVRVVSQSVRVYRPATLWLNTTMQSAFDGLHREFIVKAQAGQDTRDVTLALDSLCRIYYFAARQLARMEMN